MTVPLGTSRGIISKAAFLLIDVHTEEGITGRSYLFCYVRDAAKAITIFLEEVLRVTQIEEHLDALVEHKTEIWPSGRKTTK